MVTAVLGMSVGTKGICLNARTRSTFKTVCHGDGEGSPGDVGWVGDLADWLHSLEDDFGTPGRTDAAHPQQLFKLTLGSFHFYTHTHRVVNVAAQQSNGPGFKSRTAAGSQPTQLTSVNLKLLVGCCLYLSVNSTATCRLLSVLVGKW